MPLLLLQVQQQEHPQKKERLQPPAQLPLQLPGLFPRQAQLQAQQQMPQQAAPLERLQLPALLQPQRLPVQSLAFQIPLRPIQIRLPTKHQQPLPKANRKRLFKLMAHQFRRRLNPMQLRHIHRSRKQTLVSPRSPLVRIEAP